MNKRGIPFLILALLLLLAAGVLVLTGRSSEEDHQLVLPDTPEELRAFLDETDQRARDLIQEFVDSNGDPCSLPTAEASALWILWYSDVPALVNDTDLIILAQPVARTAELAPPDAISGPVLVSLDVTEVLKGELSNTSISAWLGTTVATSGGSLVRSLSFDFDSCSTLPMLLFLNQTKDAGVYSIHYQNWLSIDQDTIQAGELNRLFDDYSDSQTLIAAIKDVVLSQEAQRLPKGLLKCEGTRLSERWKAQAVCPGELFNPYQAFQLDSAIRGHVITQDPGPRQRVVGDVELEAGTELTALLRTLDVDTASAPLGLVTDDRIRLGVSFAQPVNDRFTASFDYSPSTGMIQMRPFSGQFPAPPAFQRAMERFLATP